LGDELSVQPERSAFLRGGIDPHHPRSRFSIGRVAIRMAF
jgi:hypothetical protein